MPVIVYGIAHCDTVKRARAWLAEHGVAASVHDFKTRALALDQPSVVKRPVVEWDQATVTVGFDPVLWTQRRQALRRSGAPP